MNQKQIQVLKSKQSGLTASIDQLECYLYDHFPDIVDIMERPPEDIIDEYGEVVGAIITYTYAILVDNTTSDVLEKLENNQNHKPG